MTPLDKFFDLAVGGWVVGGNQVENNATLWSNLQDCKISSRVEIPKLDPSVATTLLPDTTNATLTPLMNTTPSNASETSGMDLSTTNLHSTAVTTDKGTNTSVSTNTMSLTDTSTSTMATSINGEPVTASTISGSTITGKVTEVVSDTTNTNTVNDATNGQTSSGSSIVDAATGSTGSNTAEGSSNAETVTASIRVTSNAST